MSNSDNFHNKFIFLLLIALLSPVNPLHVVAPVLTQNVASSDEKLFDLDLKTQEAKLNSSYKMKCIVKIPGLTFWTVDGRAPDGSKFQILADSNLVIRNITLEDFNREYLCHALIHGRPMVESMQIFLRLFGTQRDQNRDGKSMNSSVTPDAHDADPTISEDYETTTTIKTRFGLVGGQTTLTCTAQARPYPTFTWLHANGTIIQNQTDFTITTNNENTSNLTIFVRDSTQYGKKYFCEAWNRKGKSEQGFVLKMPEKPREIPFLFPKVIGTRKIGLGLSLDKTRNFSSWSISVQFRKVGDGNESWNETTVDGSAEFEELEGLEENTTYLIRAGVKNEFILGQYSEPILVTTDKEAARIEGQGRRLSGEQGSGRGLQFHLNHDEYDPQRQPQPSDGVMRKIINSKTWSSKWVTKVGNMLIITTNTSTMEEQEDYNENDSRPK